MTLFCLHASKRDWELSSKDRQVVLTVAQKAEPSFYVYFMRVLCFCENIPSFKFLMDARTSVWFICMLLVESNSAEVSDANIKQETLFCLVLEMVIAFYRHGWHWCSRGRLKAFISPAVTLNPFLAHQSKFFPMVEWHLKGSWSLSVCRSTGDGSVCNRLFTADRVEVTKSQNKDKYNVVLPWRRKSAGVNTMGTAYYMTHKQCTKLLSHK